LAAKLPPDVMKLASANESIDSLKALSSCFFVCGLQVSYIQNLDHDISELFLECISFLFQELMTLFSSNQLLLGL